MHALGLEFGSAAQLSKRPGSVWNCLWGNALKRSPGIIRKSRVSKVKSQEKDHQVGDDK